jgi:hypothetical protein
MRAGPPTAKARPSGSRRFRLERVARLAERRVFAGSSRVRSDVAVEAHLRDGVPEPMRIPRRVGSRCLGGVSADTWNASPFGRFGELPRRLICEPPATVSSLG